jgi:hypothetical protein
LRVSTGDSRSSGTKGVDHRTGHIRIGLADVEGPRLPRRSVGNLGGPLAAPRLLGGDETRRHEHPEVIERRAGVPAEPVGQLLVRERLVERQPDDAEPVGVGEGLGFLVSRLPPGHLTP